MKAPLQELVQRAQQGDTTVLPELKEALDADASIWQTYGDLAFQARAAWLSMLAGKDLLLYESVERKLDELRAELAGPDPSPLEKLLVERVAACWLQTMYADALYAQAKGPGATPGVLRELMRKQESSQRKYLAAIKELALVRKLLKPAVSPVDLAMRPVEEGKLAGVRKGTSTPTLRLATVMN
jgi:hypothetical protein